MVQLSNMDPPTPRLRVNGAMLNQYAERTVCLIGTVTKADGGGTSFQMKASDGSPVSVRLQNPINGPLSGLVEVYGVSQGKGVVTGASFTAFPDEVGNSFDLNTYNETLKIIHATQDNPWLV